MGNADFNRFDLTSAYSNVLGIAKNKSLDNSENWGFDMVIRNLDNYIVFMNSVEDNKTKDSLEVPYRFNEAVETIIKKISPETNEEFRELRGNFYYLECQIKGLRNNPEEFYKKDKKDVVDFLENFNNKF